MKNKLQFIIFVVLINVFINPSHAFALVLSDYFPAVQGSNWEYNLSGKDLNGINYNFISHWRIDGTQDVAYGSDVYSGFKMFEETGPGTFEYTVYQLTNTGVLGVYGQDTFFHWLTGTQSSSSPEGPYTFLPSTFNIGDTFPLVFREYRYDSGNNLIFIRDINGLVTMEGIENVNALGNIFQDALKIKIDGGYSVDIVNPNGVDYQISFTDYWYYDQSVGLVKRTTLDTYQNLNSTSLLELSSYNIPQATVTPEPGSLLLFGIGITGFFGLRKKK